MKPIESYFKSTQTIRKATTSFTHRKGWGVGPLFFLLFFFSLSSSAQKWKYDFIVPDNGDFVQAIHAANKRPDKTKRFRIFLRAKYYRIKGDQNMIKAVENGQEIEFPSPMTVLTAPNTSIIGESAGSTQIENCPQHEGIDITSTLFCKDADSTYIQDVELWSNFKNDATLFANRAVALNEKNCKGNVLKNVSLMSTQDTYYTNNGGTTYLEDCKIAGTVDFICGGGTVFFNHCDIRLVPRGTTGNRDIICAPATEAERKYGYVFTDCYIDGPEHQRWAYLLGRPWRNAPRAAFINCCMNVEPAKLGWGEMHGNQPALFTEFESTNGHFELLDLSGRKKSYKNPENVEIPIKFSPSLTIEEAEEYTIDKVFPNWHPQKVAEQIVAPTLYMKGRTITWEDIPEAGCYAVLKDRKIVAFTTSPSYSIPAGTREGSSYTIRCANQRGGLGLPSEPITYPQR